MRPSRVLTVFYAATFVIGALITVPVSFAVSHHDIGARGAAIMTLSWNVLFTMILPLVLDWSERKYFKARFLELEEVASRNPELAAAITEQCERLSIQKLRLAVVDSSADEIFSYGLWGSNPRLVLPNALLSSEEKAVMLPSIEAELTRFRSQDNTIIFLMFTVVQILLQYHLLTGV